MSEVLPYLELKKDNVKEEDVKKQVKVPNIEGLSIKEATKILKENNLELQIKNESTNNEQGNNEQNANEQNNNANNSGSSKNDEKIIKTQLPKNGISVYEGTKIIATPKL